MEEITLVVPTRDRPQDLRRAIPSFVANLDDFAEVIIVDQSAGDDTQRLLIEWAQHPKLRYVRCPDRGASNGRNFGLGLTTTPLVGFTDDDCLLPEGWARAVAAVLGEPNVGGFFGAVVAEPFDSGAGFTPQVPELRERTIDSPNPLTMPIVMSANMAVRRDALAAIGGFDPYLGPGTRLKCAEDMDVEYRLLRAGYRVAVRVRPTVTHFGFRTYASRDGSETVRSAHIGMGGYYGKHIRSGDWRAALAYVGHLAIQGGRIVQSVLRRRGPLGVSRVSSALLGLGRSFRYPLDRERRLFTAPPG